MQVMIEVTNPLAREQTMTRNEDRSKIVAIKELLEQVEDFVRTAVQGFVQAALEAEMTEVLAAEKGERTEGRLGYRSGYAKGSDYACGHFGASGSARPGGAVFDGAVRALSAFGEGAGRDLGGDVCAGVFDQEGEGGHRGFMRA